MICPVFQQDQCAGKSSGSQGSKDFLEVFHGALAAYTSDPAEVVPTDFPGLGKEPGSEASDSGCASPQQAQHRHSTLKAYQNHPPVSSRALHPYRPFNSLGGNLNTLLTFLQP